MERDSSLDHSIGTIDNHVSARYLRPAMGDALESFLASHGVSKEWYIEFKNKYGYPPTCDCDARKEWLNKTAAAHPTIANIGVKLLAAITRKK